MLLRNTWKRCSEKRREIKITYQIEMPIRNPLVITTEMTDRQKHSNRIKYPNLSSKRTRKPDPYKIRPQIPQHLRLTSTSDLEVSTFTAPNNHGPSFVHKMLNDASGRIHLRAPTYPRRDRCQSPKLLNP